MISTFWQTVVNFAIRLLEWAMANNPPPPPEVHLDIRIGPVSERPIKKKE